MNTDYKDSKYKGLTEKIIGIFYKVYNNLGYGFLENVYKNAMMLCFRKENILTVSQYAIKVYYEDEIVGEYFADILVDGKALLRLKQ